VQAKVLIMARDAGAAAALAPVARSLMSGEDASATIVAYGKAAAVFEAHGLPALAFPEEPAASEVASLLHRERAIALLTGTSMRTERDAAFWAGAAERGVPSLALLDHWRNYSERFTVERPFDRMPDVIAVMDAAAARECERRGCPPERLRVTGHPHLDSLTPATPAERRRARRELGVEAGRRVVVFASEPLSRHYGRSSAEPLYLGYAEHESLAAVRDALAELDPAALLLVKLHPLEESGTFVDLVDRGGPEIRVLRAYPPRATIAAADVVTGMTSTFLLEAVLMGAPALSVRPGGGEEHFISIHADLIESVADPDGVTAAVARCLEHRGAAERGSSASDGVEGSATGRVLQAIADLSVARGTLGRADAGALVAAGAGAGGAAALRDRPRARSDARRSPSAARPPLETPSYPRTR